MGVEACRVIGVVVVGGGVCGWGVQVVEGQDGRGDESEQGAGMT